MAILHSAPTITAPEDVVNEDFTLAIGPTSESVNIVGAVVANRLGGGQYRGRCTNSYDGLRLLLPQTAEDSF